MRRQLVDMKMTAMEMETKRSAVNDMPQESLQTVTITDRCNPQDFTHLGQLQIGLIEIENMTIFRSVLSMYAKCGKGSQGCVKSTVSNFH